MRIKTLAQWIASTAEARVSCQKAGNMEWAARWTERLDRLALDLPSGSGVDAGTTIDRDRTNGSRIVLLCSFHHMDEHGGYDGWTDHTITVRPAFEGFEITISGRDRNQVKEYLADLYYEALGHRYAERLDHEADTVYYDRTEQGAA